MTMLTSYRPRTARSLVALVQRLNGVGLALACGLGYALLLPDLPTGDGTRWADFIADHTWYVNPNYVLMVPLATTVHAALQAIGIDLSAFRLQQFLNVAAGTSALVMFSVTLKRVCVSRVQSSLLLVAAAYSFNGLYLATSDHIKLLVAPFLAIALDRLVQFSAKPARQTLLEAGLALGVSASFMINSIIWTLLAAIVVIATRARGTRASILDAVGLVAIGCGLPALVLVGFYSLESPPNSFVNWVTHYGGGRISADSGIQPVTGLTLARAAFAFLKNFVYSDELGPVLKSMLLGSQTRFRPDASNSLQLATSLLVATLFCTLAFQLCRTIKGWTPPQKFMALHALVMIFSFALFALLWDSGEEEFWFQVTFPVLLMVALHLRNSRSPAQALTFGAAGLALVSTNILTFAIPRHSYEFEKYVSEVVRVIPRDSLVITDGTQPIGTVIGTARDRTRNSFRMITVVRLAELAGFDRAVLSSLTQREVESSSRAGHCVVVIGVFDASPIEHPWTLLGERFRLGPQDFRAAFEAQDRVFRRGRIADRAAWVTGSDQCSLPDHQGALLDPREPGLKSLAQVGGGG